MEDPELTDEAGDVRAPLLQPAQGDRPHIDIIAAYARWDRPNDDVVFSLVVNDTTAMSETLGDRRASCDLWVSVTDVGRQVARLQFAWTKDQDAPIDFEGWFHRDGEGRDVLPVNASMSFGAPGTVAWPVDRSLVRSLGAAAGNFTVDCSDRQRLAGFGGSFAHYDDAEGNGVFSIPARPQAEESSHDGVGMNGSGRESDEEQPGGSSAGFGPGPSFAAAAVGLLAAASRRRR